MFKTKPILTVPEQITEMINDAILSGQLKLGDKLPSENELAEQFGVSRTTIREALDLLESQQIINTRQGKHGGHFVTKRTTEDVVKYLGHYVALSVGAQHMSLEDLCEIRLVVEVKGCGLAALRRTEDELKEMKRFLPPKNQFISAYRFHHMDIAFHRSIARATHNQLLLLTMNSFEKAQEVLALQVGISAPIQEGLLNNLYRIYQTIADKDRSEAENAMTEHLEYFRNMTKNARL